MIKGSKAIMLNMFDWARECVSFRFSQKNMFRRADRVRDVIVAHTFFGDRAGTRGLVMLLLLWPQNHKASRLQGDKVSRPQGYKAKRQ